MDLDFANVACSKAIKGLGYSQNCYRNGRIRYDTGQVLGTDALVDTFRVFGQAQKEISAFDVQNLCHFFVGPAQDAEFLYQQCFNLMVSQEDDQLMGSYVLNKAVREYGKGRLEWESFIRKMIRKGVNVHNRVSDAHIDEPDECYLGHSIEEELRLMRKGRQSMHGTPLDELFINTVSPYEAELAAQHWLFILRTEEVDVVTYLKEEIAIHAAHQQLTYSGKTGTTRRQLVFSLGASPTCWWERLLDPRSGAYLVREEFKGMYTMWDSHRRLGPLADPERDVAPFDFPDWSDERMPIDLRQSETIPEGYHPYIFLRLDAEDRLNRRWMRRASKSARARRTKGPRKIPGAWPV